MPERERDGDMAPRAPQSGAELFFAFNRLALQGFGGVLPVAHRELVERRQWLTGQQFVELLSLGQVLPGPNIVNMALIMGDRHFGWRGALAASAGLLLVPMAIVLALATLYLQFAALPGVTGALRGMGAVAAGLVLATAVKLFGTLAQSPLGRGLGGLFAVLTFAGVGALRWPMVWVVLVLGTGATAIAWQRLKAAAP